MSNAAAVKRIAHEVVEKHRPPAIAPKPDASPQAALHRRIRRALGLLRTDVEVLTARFEEHAILVADLLNQWDTMEETDDRDTRSARRLVEPFDD